MSELALGFSSYVAQSAVGLVFLLSATAKVRQPSRFIRGVSAYAILPHRAAWAFGLLLVPTELVAAALLVLGFATTPALLVAIALLAIFLVAVSLNIHRGNRVPCSCFGDPDEIVSIRTVVRQMMLLITATWALAASALLGDRPVLLAQGMYGQWLITVVCAVFVGLLGAWLMAVPELVQLGRRAKRHPAME